MQEFDVVVEIPAGSRNKYVMDHRVGRIRLERQLFTSTCYPADYGYIPGTVAADGDRRPSTARTTGVPRWLRDAAGRGLGAVVRIRSASRVAMR